MRSSDPTAVSVDDSSASNREPRYFVGGIHRHITQQDLERYFSGFGDLASITLKRDAAGNSRGYGWVLYRSAPPGLIRQEAHVLKGAVLTVEQARSRGTADAPRSDRRATNNGSGGNLRRRRRSRSRSRSRSSSSSPSSSSLASRGNYRRRFSPPPYDRSKGNASLPSIAVGSSRLPPLSAQLYPSLPPAQVQTPTPNNNALVSNTGRDPSTSMSETYVCIPLTLCPPEFLNDPRTLCARLDQSRLNSLNIVPQPLISTAAQVTLPPPPPPVQQHGQLSSLGTRSSGNNVGPPPPGPPPSLHSGLQRGPLH
ncbi:putative RNA-binding protein [Trypanosoma grayi]|uniref:putative RNA-binding protein n=1 Tax=Trypanosoma grayi TaxID=71804 RepID=UPI0004F40CB5|nr:putative RNA-binding protein [Trypanosoma grayi]KEG07250.1 putative RNA-binding protein [Trypanosoma grayi]